MILARLLPKIDSNQLINPERLDGISSQILKDTLKGYDCLILDYGLTKAEVSYLTLYGYRVDSSSRYYTTIFWCHV